MAARDTAVNAIFMLHAYKIIAIEIEEIGGPFVGTKVFLRKLESHLFAALWATEDQKNGMKSFIENGPGKATFEGK